MKPIEFPQMNTQHVLDGCGDLPTHVIQGDENFPPQIISCWQLSEQEKLKIQQTGRIWLNVWGQGQPPVSLEVLDPFNDDALPDKTRSGMIDPPGVHFYYLRKYVYQSENIVGIPFATVCIGGFVFTDEDT
ncbi:MAG: hypothetical protein ACTSSK_03535, partial [Candidatus Heimdallarchaeota archaeon]